MDTSKVEVVKGVFLVGKRSHLNYFRVYQKSNGKFIRFKLGLKKSSIKKFQSDLFLHQFEKLGRTSNLQFLKRDY